MVPCDRGVGDVLGSLGNRPVKEDAVFVQKFFPLPSTSFASSHALLPGNPIKSETGTDFHRHPNQCRFNPESRTLPFTKDYSSFFFSDSSEVTKLAVDVSRMIHGPRSSTGFPWTI